MLPTGKLPSFVKRIHTKVMPEGAGSAAPVSSIVDDDPRKSHEENLINARDRFHESFSIVAGIRAENAISHALLTAVERSMRTTELLVPSLASMHTYAAVDATCNALATARTNLLQSVRNSLHPESKVTIGAYGCPILIRSLLSATTDTIPEHRFSTYDLGFREKVLIFPSFVGVDEAFPTVHLYTYWEALKTRKIKSPAGKTPSDQATELTMPLEVTCTVSDVPFFVLTPKRS